MKAAAPIFASDFSSRWNKQVRKHSTSMQMFAELELLKAHND